MKITLRLIISLIVVIGFVAAAAGTSYGSEAAVSCGRLGESIR